MKANASCSRRPRRFDDAAVVAADDGGGDDVGCASRLV